MEYFKFVSARGSIDISLASPYVLTSHENLNGAEVQFQENKFIDTDGAEYTNVLYEPDELTVKGFIKAENKKSVPHYRAELFRILNGKDSGYLYYICGNKVYFTEALTMRPAVGETVQNVLSFTLHFKRTAPLWKENRLNRCSIYMLTKNLKTEFTLPLVFSKRTTRCNVLNGGDIPADCLITIKGLSVSEETAGNEISIINHTTNEKIALSYLLAVNEQIKIDTAGCSVTSSLNGNIINRLKAESSFIKLAAGVNDIEVINSDAENELYAEIEFYNTVLGV